MCLLARETLAARPFGDSLEPRWTWNPDRIPSQSRSLKPCFSNSLLVEMPDLGHRVQVLCTEVPSGSSQVGDPGVVKRCALLFRNHYFLLYPVAWPILPKVRSECIILRRRVALRARVMVKSWCRRRGSSGSIRLRLGFPDCWRVSFLVVLAKRGLCKRFACAFGFEREPPTQTIRIPSEESAQARVARVTHAFGRRLVYAPGRPCMAAGQSPSAGQRECDTSEPTSCPQSSTLLVQRSRSQPGRRSDRFSGRI